MLIMMYAHARVSGDGSLLSRHVRALSIDLALYESSSYGFSSMTPRNGGQII